MSSREKSSVLVVDDNDATVTLITALLGRDFDVDVARSGTEALEKTRTRPYACILLDLRLPVVDGYDVLDALAERNPDQLFTTIILTAAVNVRDLDRVKNYAVHSVITKPFDIETLLSAVKDCAAAGNRSGGALLGGGMLLLLADLLRRAESNVF